MTTAAELAAQILKAKPGLASLDRYQVETEVRQYIQDNYIEVFSKVKAREGLDLQVDARDKQKMDDLYPYFTDTTPVIRALEQILTGIDTPGTPVATQQTDPSQMTHEQYRAWRESGHSPFRTSQGLLG
jgi:hypothetical protein